jgi:serine/threonine protein kinase
VTRSSIATSRSRSCQRSWLSDSDRVARFVCEAKTLAALNHPNIGAIHELEESNGVTALVLELVEGPTLADRIALGPVPLEEALPIARQIADALEAAHEQGIVHRDLKSIPATVPARPISGVTLTTSRWVRSLAIGRMSLSSQFRAICLSVLEENRICPVTSKE